MTADRRAGWSVTAIRLAEVLHHVRRAHRALDAGQLVRAVEPFAAACRWFGFAEAAATLGELRSPSRARVRWALGSLTTRLRIEMARGPCRICHLPTTAHDEVRWDGEPAHAVCAMRAEVARRREVA